MRFGITLPQFRVDVESALRVARRAEAAGVDGLFVFDHLFPIGSPDRPAVHGMSLLAALLAETDRVRAGTLVARVSLLPNAVLANMFATAAAIGGSRVIAGLGAGDRLSKPENLAYGVPFAPAAERLRQLADCARRTLDLGIETWIGGRSPAVREVTRDVGAVLNLWGTTPEETAAEMADAAVETTWGGTVVVSDAPVAPEPLVTAGSVDAVAPRLRAVAATGVSWIVAAPTYAGGPSKDDETLDRVLEAASAADLLG